MQFAIIVISSYAFCMQPLESPSIVLAPIAAGDASAKVIGIGPDKKLYYSVGPTCDRTGACQCGGQVSTSPAVQYCSISQAGIDGSSPVSKITGSTKSECLDPHLLQCNALSLFAAAMKIISLQGQGMLLAMILIPIAWPLRG